MFSAHDPIIRRTFKAPTEEGLKELLNHPRIVTWRRSRQARVEETGRLNALHGQAHIQAAQDKRARRNAKRIQLANG